MKCPECGNEMKKGTVVVTDGHMLIPRCIVTWVLEEEQKKFIRKNAIGLGLKAEGYYCDECMKVFAAFEER